MRVERVRQPPTNDSGAAWAPFVCGPILVAATLMDSSKTMALVPHSFARRSV